MLTMCWEEKGEIMNKLNVETLNDQLSGLSIQTLFLSLKVSCVYYDDSSIFKSTKYSIIKKCHRFAKEVVMKNTISLMNVSK